MDISYNWLKDLIDIELTGEDVAAGLTRVGLTVEALHPHGDDVVLDIDLTSNRSDCLSHLGVARELSAITGSPVVLEKRRNGDREPDAPFPAVLAADIVRVEDPALCPRFTARVIRGVKIGPSPQWLVDRLEAVGERSINNVADITNYVMLELGQPMHAFDLDKLAGSRIVVRRAKDGESITTLDDVERKLDSTMLAICDADKPAAVAGIMGGMASSITESTTNVLLEVAYFDRANIRATSRKLDLATQASYRFERGVDIEALKRASDRAVALIVELAGGEAGQFVDVRSEAAEESTVSSPDLSGEVKRLTGLQVSDEYCTEILGRLGISSPSKGVYISPSWRHDIAISEDLVEEVARHTGYENIAEELPPAFGAGEYQNGERRKIALRRMLADSGFDEAITYSFIAERFDGRYAAVPNITSGGLVTLRDSVIEGAVRMRPTLLPGLLDAVRLNLNHQNRDIMLFEIGKAFAAANATGEPPVEREILGFAITGGAVGEKRLLAEREMDFYDLKGFVEAALDSAGCSGVEFSPAEAVHLRRGQSAVVRVNGDPIGTIGRLSEEISADYKFKQAVYVAELDLQAALAAPREAVVYRPLSKFPAVTRDVSLLVDRAMTFAQISEVATNAPVEILERVNYVDIYEGKGLAENQRSLTIRFEFRSDERTLVDAEVDTAHALILQQLETALGVRQRF